MKRVTRWLILSAAAGAAVYVGIAAYSDWARVRATLARFSWFHFVAALLLALGNYSVRFFKWDYFLSRVGVRIPRGRSLCVYLSGFTLTVTPGKLGEVVKSYLLAESDGIAMTRTAPIVAAERVTDLVALMLLAATGVTTYKVGLRGVVVGAIMVAGFLLVMSSRRLMHGLLRPLGHKAVAMYDSMQQLIAWRSLLYTTTLSVVAWACECAAFWIVIHGFPGASASLGLATFIYAAMTIAGALSFVPGGLGVTEAGMTALLVNLAQGLDKPAAFAATFVVRLATLWFAVGIGIIALTIFQRRYHVSVDLDAARSASSRV
jgi:uncharacterized protein (TIRG00374 family)